LLEEGCSHYMSKPFMKKEIVQLVQELLYHQKDHNDIILN
jgi:CheY-like chemotaxis protein